MLARSELSVKVAGKPLEKVDAASPFLLTFLRGVAGTRRSFGET
jgi:hypothetical protein